MSFILDALKKSERQRQAGQVPGLTEITAEKETRSRRWIPLLLGVLLAVNLLGLAYWAFRHTGPSATGEPVAAIAPPASPTASLPLDQPVNQPIVNTGGEPPPAMMPPRPAAPVGNPVIGVPLTNTPSTAVKGTALTPPPPQPVRATPLTPPAQGPGSVRATPLMPPSQGPGSVRAVPLTPPAPLPTNPANDVPETTEAGETGLPPQQQPRQADLNPRDPVGHPSPQVNAPESAPKTAPSPPLTSSKPTSAPRSLPVPTLRKPTAKMVDRVNEDMVRRGYVLNQRQAPVEPVVTGNRGAIVPGTPYLRDLPQEFQNRLPHLKITMFAYSRVPAERFVIIDMKKYRIGEQVPGGALLLGIEAESIDLELDGQKFKLPRF